MPMRLDRASDGMWPRGRGRLPTVCRMNGLPPPPTCITPRSLSCIPPPSCCLQPPPPLTCMAMDTTSTRFSMPSTHPTACMPKILPSCGCE